MSLVRAALAAANFVVAALDYAAWLKTGEARDLVAALAWLGSGSVWLWMAVVL